MLLGDGLSWTAYVEAYNNQVVSTSNYGVAIASGHDMVFQHNRVLSSGLFPDGWRIAAQNVGVYIWDLYVLGPMSFYNNTAHDNLVGWADQLGTGRNDWWIPDVTSFPWPGEVTRAVEAAAFASWRSKVVAGDVPVGPRA